MENNSILKIVIWYIKSHLKTIIAHCLFVAIFIVVFYLYGLELEVVLYAFTVWAFIAVLFVGYDFVKYYRRHMLLYDFHKKITTNLEGLPIPSNLIEVDYQKNLSVLYQHTMDMTLKLDHRQREMIDYYTLWAHQIKTPIAAMRLLLQSQESEQNKDVLSQLFKIEKYVEMVLGYLRIDNVSADLVLNKCKLSEIIKQAIRKYAAVFIGKDISIEFKEMDCYVLTDEKWLVFVIEQLLSNALKYTTSGKISIYMDDVKEKRLIIQDTGIGIGKEDLPRIFEKGFTGYNGRLDKKATGIGLYLCKKILNKLSHDISITSKVGIGTTVSIDLSSSQQSSIL